MTPIPRRFGWFMMALALLIAAFSRSDGAIPDFGPIPAVLIVLLVGGIGAILVFTDILVRSLYAQVEIARAAEEANSVDEPLAR